MLFMMLLYLISYTAILLLMVYEHRIMNGVRESVVDFVRDINFKNREERNFLIMMCIFSAIAPFFMCGVLIDSIVKFKKEEEK